MATRVATAGPAVAPVKLSAAAKTNGRRNKAAGYAFELESLHTLREQGFPHLVTARGESKNRDNQKVDLMNKDEWQNGRFPFNIQCKNLTGKLEYPKLLAELPVGTGAINVIFHKQTVKSETGKFMGKGKFAILYLADFIQMMEKLQRYEIRLKVKNQLYVEKNPFPASDQIEHLEELLIKAEGTDAGMTGTLVLALQSYFTPLAQAA